MCVPICPAFQAEPAGTAMNLNVPQVQLINPENQIVEASTNNWSFSAQTTVFPVSTPLFLISCVSLHLSRTEP
jgi:hypothetical protein